MSVVRNLTSHELCSGTPIKWLQLAVFIKLPSCSQGLEECQLIEARTGAGTTLARCRTSILTNTDTLAVRACASVLCQGQRHFTAKFRASKY